MELYLLRNNLDGRIYGLVNGGWHLLSMDGCIWCSQIVGFTGHPRVVDGSPLGVASGRGLCSLLIGVERLDDGVFRLLGGLKNKHPIIVFTFRSEIK